LPSPTGEGIPEPERPGKPKPEARRPFTGKVAGLIFDHLGDFEGFLLETEEKTHEFVSREREIQELAERAGANAFGSPYSARPMSWSGR
jgi:hypothetical protein